MRQEDMNKLSPELLPYILCGSMVDDTGALRKARKARKTPSRSAGRISPTKIKNVKKHV